MYGKHFESMYSGSMIGAGAHVFAVWGYVISHQRPPDFTVELNSTLLAFILGEPEPRIKEAIDRLCSPDPKSRSHEHDGKRLIKLGEYLYQVVNGAHYHSIKSEEDKRAYWREQKRRQKEGEIVPEAVPLKEYHQDTVPVLNRLCIKSSRTFREVDSNLSVISARLKEPGVTTEGVEMMVDRMCAKWKTDPKMSEYLRPSTLFGKSNFDNYYSSRDMPVSDNGKHKSMDSNQTSEGLHAPLL